MDDVRIVPSDAVPAGVAAVANLTGAMVWEQRNPDGWVEHWLQLPGHAPRVYARSRIVTRGNTIVWSVEPGPEQRRSGYPRR